MSPEPNGCRGALLAPAAIFLPSFLLVTGALLSKTSYAQNPFPIRSQRHQRGGVGTAAGYLYNPVWTSAIYSPADSRLGLVAFAVLIS
jgi:chromate transporter